MFTNLAISEQDARLVFARLTSRHITGLPFSFDDLFNNEDSPHNDISLKGVDGALRFNKSLGNYSIQFSRFIHAVPTQLVELGVEVLAVEYVQSNADPGNAVPGYYAGDDFTAEIEIRVVISGNAYKTANLAKNVRLSAGNIAVAAQRLSELNQGQLQEYRRYAL